MPVAGSVYTAQFVGSMEGNITRTTFAWVLGPGAEALTEAELITFMNTALVGPAPAPTDTNLTRYLRDCCGSDWNLDYVNFQKIFNERRPYNRRTINLGGLAAGSAQTLNTASVLTFQTALAGRSQLSTKHIPALPVDRYTNGNLLSAQKSALTALGTNHLLPLISLTPAFSMSPVVYHRNAAPTSRVDSLINFIVGDTVRVMRRRTLRIGE